MVEVEPVKEVIQDSQEEQPTLSKREQIKADLRKQAQDILARKQTIDVKEANHTTGKYIRQRWEGDIPLTVSELKVDGLTVDDFVDLFENWVSANPFEKQEIKLTKLADEDDGKFEIVHQHVKTPWGISNRSLVVCFYHHDMRCESQEYEFIVSSKGNEDYIDKYTKEKKFGDDVIATNVITWWHVKATDTGVQLTNIGMFDPAGSIPFFAMSVISGKQAESIEQIAEVVRQRAKK